MIFEDKLGVQDLCVEAGDKFPRAWAVFFSEFDEPVEARREAFATLIGYVNSRFDGHAPSISQEDLEQQQRLICIAFLSFLGLERCDQARIDRYLRDLVPVDQTPSQDPVPPVDSTAAPKSTPIKPTGRALLKDGSVVEVRCDSKKPLGYEILVNHGEDENWQYLAAVAKGPYLDRRAHKRAENAPGAQPERWSYLLRYIQFNSEDTGAYKPVGLWSDPIAVTQSER